MADGGHHRNVEDEVLASLSNLAAEMAVIGSVLYDNNNFDSIPNIGENDFYAPVNAFLWREISSIIDKGQTADGVTLLGFSTDPLIKQVGGAGYFTTLLDCAVFGPEIRDYASVIYNLANRRRLYNAGRQMAVLAKDEKSRSLGVSDIAEKTDSILQGLEAEETVDDWSNSADDAATFFEEQHLTDMSALVSSGWESLDRQLGNMVAGDYIVLDGRPGMGKSAVAVSLAFNIAKQEVPDNQTGGVMWNGRKRRVVTFYSLEMTKEQLAQRAVSTAVDEKEGDVIPYKLMREKALTSDQREKCRQYARELPLIEWTQRPGISLSYIRSQLRKQKRKNGRIDAVFIDFLQIMKGPGSSKYDVLSEISSGLKDLAKEYNCVVIVLAQVKRDVEDRDDKRPRNSDVKNCGDVEQDATAMLHIFREYEYIKDQDCPKGQIEDDWDAHVDAMFSRIEIGVGKNRFGSQGRVNLYIRPETGLISTSKEMVTRRDRSDLFS